MNPLWNKIRKVAQTLALLTALVLPGPALAQAMHLPAPAPAVAAQVEESTKVVVLELIDTHAQDADGLGIAVDGLNIRNTFETAFNCPEGRGRLVRCRLQDEELTPERVLATIQKLVADGTLRPTDTLVVYYSGHGAWHVERGQVLTMRYGRLFRSDLQAAMTQTGCRLKVLLTDCCSSTVGMFGGAPSMKRAAASVTAPSWKVMRNLFLPHRGTVDITAASPGQTAMGNERLGGIFTKVMVDLLRSPADELDNSGEVVWSRFFERLQKDAGEVNQGQKAYSFSLGESQAPGSVVAPSHHDPARLRAVIR